MRVKAQPPLSQLAAGAVSALLEAYLEINHLKQLYRQGWLRRGLPPEQCESVAEHVFGMALLAWWIADAHFPGLDGTKILRMTLIHELGEIYTGDLTPADGVDPAEKHRRERAALEQVVGKLTSGAAIVALWEEYEGGQTPEARLVKQIDRLEMALQAGVYQRGGMGEGFADEFLASAERAITEPLLQGLLQESKEL